MIPIFANVSFGIYAFMPLGWAFMVTIIAIETVILSFVLDRAWWNGEIAKVVFLANSLSGIVGFGISFLLNGGWWLVIWMPWVSGHEVDLYYHLLPISIYYIVAFGLSVIIEGATELFFLRHSFQKKNIWRACRLSNVISYFIGGLAMYSWSFGLWN